MRGSLQIKGTDVELTDSIKEAVREKAEKLDRVYDNVINCNVAIESPRRRYAKGTFYGAHRHDDSRQRNRCQERTS